MANLNDITNGAASIKEARAALRAEVKELRDQLGFEQKKEKSAKICAELLARIDSVLSSAPGGSAHGASGAAANAAAPAAFKLGVYSAFADEVDLDPLIQGAYERGLTVCFPCMMHDAHGLAGACEQTMEFRAILQGDYAASKKTLGSKGSTRKTALEQGESGVPFLLHPLRRYHHDSPELASMPYVSADELDMLVCPCVAFDAQGNRLGYGAGNYDRYLSQLLVPGTLEFKPKVQLVGVAFTEQQVPNIPVEEHDIPLPFVWA